MNAPEVGRERGALQRSVFDSWPESMIASLAHALAGEGDQAGFTLSLSAIDLAAEPATVRTVLLSAGECCVTGANTLRLALWPTSRATGALRHHARATLAWVAEQAYFQAQIDTVALGVTPGGLACFEARLAADEAQRAAYAELRSGIGFVLGEQRGEVLARWARQLEEMRQLPGACD